MIYTVTLNPALDRTLTVERLAVDAVNRVLSVRTDPGGKGINVSKVIARMGGTSVAMGLLGGRTGEAIRQSLDALNVCTDFITVPGETRTNIKIVDAQLRQNTDLNERGARVNPEAEAALLERLLERLLPQDIVVLAGSLPEGLAPDTYCRWTAACRASGARVMLDADGAAFAAGVSAGPYLVKPNLRELSEWAGKPLHQMEEIAGAARELCAQGVRRTVVSLGAQGALFVCKEGAVYAPAIPVKVSSTVGAGDSVVAALALAFENRMPPGEAMRLAMAAGAANAMSDGTQAADRATVEALCPLVKLEPLVAPGKEGRAACADVTE